MSKLMIPQAMMWKYGVKCSKNATGDDIETWDSDSIPKPNKIQLVKDLTEYEKWYADNEYKAKRAKEYPDLVDQVEIIVKALKHLASNNVPVGLDAVQLITDIDAIKAKYPKP